MKKYSGVVFCYVPAGDFIECVDCGMLQLVPYGGECHTCDSSNTLWARVKDEDFGGTELMESTVEELNGLGFLTLSKDEKIEIMHPDGKLEDVTILWLTEDNLFVEGEDGGRFFVELNSYLKELDDAGALRAYSKVYEVN